MHAQRDAAEVGADRKTLGLDEPQLVTLDHDLALVDNDEAGVVGPGVARDCDLLVREHAGHVARLVDVEPHTQCRRPLRRRSRSVKPVLSQAPRGSARSTLVVRRVLLASPLAA